MKKLLFILISCSAFAVWGHAQEELFEEPAVDEPAKVREDSFLIQKEMVIWRTDQEGGSSVPMDTCQAIRIHPKWFLTAAHCVYPSCRGSLPCTVQITLAEGEMRQRVRIKHSTASKNVFIYDGFFPGQNRISSVDVALVKFDPMTATYSHEAWSDKENQFVPISQETFEKKLPHSPETRAQLNATGARLVGVSGISNAKLLPQIAVPLMQNGNLSYRVSPSRDVFFIKKLQFFIAPSFGVEQGNSGGGVFTAQGDLVGLVSALVYSKGSAAFQNDEGKTVLTLQNAREYFLFTGFNANTLHFIRNHIPSLRTIDADTGFVKPATKNFNTIIKTLDKAHMSLE